MNTSRQAFHARKSRMTLTKYEGSKQDKRADKAAVREINRKRK